MIRRLLVANRGEIARRVFAHLPGAWASRRRRLLRRRRRRAARRPRPTTRCGCPATRRPTRTCAATCSSPPPAGPAPTRSTPATASWPRTPTSPRRCIDAGLTWVGPPPKAIAAMGSKLEAKALLAEAGVPVLPIAGPTPRRRSTDVPGAGQGVRRRRRAGHADRAATGRAGRGGRARRGARRRPRSATATVFCERYVERGPAHRGADPRRRARHRGRARRAGVLDPAPAPEDHRGGAVAGGRRRAARRAVRRRRSPRPGRSATSAPARSSSCSRPTASSTSWR